MRTRIREIVSIAWFTTAQLFTIPANIVITGLLRLTVERPDNFVVPPGTLIIANHQSRIDPFLITYHIGIRNVLRVAPIRYPVTAEYMQKKIVGLCIRLLGGYNIGSTPTERLQKLLFTRELLKKKYTVVLFPEGKIVRDSDMVADFKRGANALFTENYPVVFVRLTGINSKHRFHFWKNKTTRLTYSQCYDTSISQEEKIEMMSTFFTEVPGGTTLQ